MQPPHQEDRISKGSAAQRRMSKGDANVPAQVCKFLINSLQRHDDGCVCCIGGWECGCGCRCSSREVLEGAANGKKFWVLESLSLQARLATRIKSAARGYAERDDADAGNAKSVRTCSAEYGQNR